VTNSSGGNFRMQARQSGDQGTGGPHVRPGSGDKRAVLLLAVGIAVLGGIVVLIGM